VHVTSIFFSFARPTTTGNDAPGHKHKEKKGKAKYYI
jgi:hypothetical protein